MYCSKVQLQLLTITSLIKQTSELHVYLTSNSLGSDILLIVANPAVSPTLQDAHMTDCWTYGIVSKLVSLPYLLHDLPLSHMLQIRILCRSHDEQHCQ
jgi:hypothetical protein